MNNKGQTLVLFVILVPFVLAICAFAFDSAYILIKDNELESIAKSSVRSIMEDDADYDKVISVIKENDSNIEVININSDSIHLKNKIVGYLTCTVITLYILLSINVKGQISISCANCISKSAFQAYN